MIQSKGLFMFITLLFLFALSSVSFHACGTAPADQQITLTQEEYRMLKTNLLQLDKNNQELSSKIKMLENQSQIALISTHEQAKQLQVAKNTINEQNKQLQLANQNLQKQQESLEITQNSLMKAEAYLNEQKKEIDRANQSKKKQNRKHVLIETLLGAGLIYSLAH